MIPTPEVPLGTGQSSHCPVPRCAAPFHKRGAETVGLTCQRDQILHIQLPAPPPSCPTSLLSFPGKNNHGPAGDIHGELRENHTTLTEQTKHLSLV